MKNFSKKAPAILTVIIAVIVLLAAGIKVGVFSTKEATKGIEKNASKENNKQVAEVMNNFSDIDLSGLNAKTITGETVTSDYFKDYDITMVNLWATYCNPCVKEMPEIAKLYKDRPDKSNIISICVGSDRDEEDARLAAQIMKDSNAEFLTLIPDKIITNALLSKVEVVPTTVFVDKNGDVIGEPILGAQDLEEYRKAIIDRMELAKND